MKRCAVCRHPLKKGPAATRGHAAFGPTCARALNLLPMRRRRSAAIEQTTTTPEVDPRQIDWVTLANDNKDHAQ